MDLQDLVPPLPTDFVEALQECGIRTDMDLLFPGSVEDLQAKLSSGVVSRDILETYTAQLAESASAPVSTGVECYRRASLSATKDPRFRSGVHALDVLLDGFGGSRVIEISGVKGSGKSALALHLVCKHLSEVSDSSVLWLDTTGDFQIDRAVRWLAAAEGEASGTALDRLHIAMPADVEEADNILDALRQSLSHPAKGGPVIRCVVIDTLSKLLSCRLSATSSQGHAIMTTFMRQLRSMARTFSLAIFIINDTSYALPYNAQSAFASNTRKPALGPTFAFLTDACLWLAKYDADHQVAQEGSTTYIAEVLRSRKTQSRTWCTFRIRDGVFLQS